MTIFEKALINEYQYFKNNSYDVDQKDETGKSILHYAVLGNSIETVIELIKKGVTINILDDNFETPIFDCARKAKIEIAKILIINYAKLDIKNIKGETLMHLAASKADKKFIKLLIENDAPIAQKTIDDKYPVHYAVLSGQIDVIKFLLAISNQSFLLLDQKNNNLLHYASQTTNDLMIYFLISEGLNPNLLNDNYETPLFNAVRFGNKETVLALLNSDAYIDLINKNNESVLETASVHRKYQMHTLLTNYQMLPKYERLKRNQALTIATLNRDHRKIIDLINNMVTIKYDKFNFSAIDYAQIYKFKEIEKTLKTIKIR